MWAEMPMLRRLMSSRSVANCLAQTDEVAGASGARPDRGPLALPVGRGWTVRSNPLRLAEASALDVPPLVPPRRRSIVVAMVTISSAVRDNGRRAETRGTPEPPERQNVWSMRCDAIFSAGFMARPLTRPNRKCGQVGQSAKCSKKYELAAARQNNPQLRQPNVSNVSPSDCKRQTSATEKGSRSRGSSRRREL